MKFYMDRCLDEAAQMSACYEELKGLRQTQTQRKTLQVTVTYYAYDKKLILQNFKFAYSNCNAQYTHNTSMHTTCDFQYVKQYAEYHHCGVQEFKFKLTWNCGYPDSSLFAIMIPTDLSTQPEVQAMLNFIKSLHNKISQIICKTIGKTFRIKYAKQYA